MGKTNDTLGENILVSPTEDTPNYLRQKYIGAPGKDIRESRQNSWCTQVEHRRPPGKRNDIEAHRRFLNMFCLRLER